MNPPRYLAPSTIAEAVRSLAEEGEGAYPLAGGTDLVVRMRAGLVRPTALVDLQRIPELAVIVEQDGRIRVGATVTLAKLVASPALRRLAPVLAEAGAQMGAVQLRNLATVGGNLASAVPSADLAPPLLVLDAEARITGPTGERTVPLEQFFAGPHRSVLRPGEILTDVEVPAIKAAASDGGTGAAFLKFGRRSAQVLAVVNAAAWVRLRRGVLEGVRIALGAVAPTPIRARSAENLLQGAPPDRERLDEAARLAAQETRPISDMRATAEFRREISRVLVRRALEQAIRRAELEGLRHAL